MNGALTAATGAKQAGGGMQPAARKKVVLSRVELVEDRYGAAGDDDNCREEQDSPGRLRCKACCPGIARFRFVFHRHRRPACRTGGG